MKHLYLGITDNELLRFSDAVLGLTLSFGFFSCEVLVTSENIYNLIGYKK